MSNATNPTSPKLVQSHEGEHHEDFGDSPVVITSATYLFTICASVNSCNLGYDIGVSTEAGRLLQADLGLTRVERELFVGSLNFWAMFGSFAAQYSSDTFGRRRTFLVAAIGFIVGLVIMAASQSYVMLMVGRMFVGLGVGVGLAIDPLYIAEVTPAKHRGELVTWAEIALNFGIVLGFAQGIFLAGFDDNTAWRLMFLFGCIMPTIMIFLVLCVLPESPRWLVSQRRFDEARAILGKIYPENMVGPVLTDIQEALATNSTAERLSGWSILLSPSPAFRRMLWVGIAAAVAQQAVGIDALQYYLIDVLDESGINSETDQSLILVLLGLVKLFFIVVGGRLLDKRGRRPLFSASLIGCAVATFILGMGFIVGDEPSTGATVAGLALYLAFFSIGLGPGAWLIPSEVFATSIRAKAMSVTTVLNRAAATIMASTFLSVANGIGWGGFFLLLSLICILFLVFVYKYLPETKGRSLEDMALYFAEITGDSTVLEMEAELVRRRRPIVGGSARDQASASKAEGQEII